jgi:hypothetical protein
VLEVLLLLFRRSIFVSVLLGLAACSTVSEAPPAPAEASPSTADASPATPPTTSETWEEGDEAQDADMEAQQPPEASDADEGILAK